ncbi:hypothetical protein [Actinomadura litoris]|uniref:hypothetical protein n=1 Tax=Actinomadura litoris TaxID=2678616 RepID=UPI001FA7E081|nr:hypothetical protein [Actinomadura litoris]
MRLTSLAVAATVLAGLLSSAPSTPAAHAGGYYTCFFGDTTPGENGYYDLTAHNCDVNGVDVVIKVISGATGKHRCQTAFSWNGFVDAKRCRPEP